MLFNDNKPNLISSMAFCSADISARALNDVDTPVADKSCQQREDTIYTYLTAAHKKVCSGNGNVMFIIT